MQNQTFYPAHRVCGIRVHSWPHEDVLTEINSNIKGPRNSLYISITNTEMMYHARREVQYRDYVERAHLSLCDGIGVVIGARMQGKEVRRFTGPDLVLEACKYGVERNWRHYVYGGREGIANLMTNKLMNMFPGMITVGTRCSMFRELTPQEEVEVITEINNAKPDILWVCLGQPLQESWIAQYIDRIEVPWLVGVGAALDFHAGTARWAPKWVRKIGMEWLFRLCCEPRMFKRNVWSFIFLFEAIWEAFCGKMATVR